ncbi:MAG: TRAP transporter small permease [Pseudomonadales bacterium]|nr:TRAP transporter small permease [Pseudomonadales bacterium]
MRIRGLGLRLRQLENALLLLLFLLMMVVAVWQIIMRHTRWGGLVWADDFLRVEVLWLAMLGAVVASRDRTHLGLDLARRFLPELPRRLVERLVAALTTLLASVLAWYCYLFVHEEMDAGTQAFGNVPSWMAEAILPVGFGLIALHYLRHTLWPGREDKFS